MDTLKKQVLGYLNNKLNLDIKSYVISSCHVLSVNKYYEEYDKQEIIARFTNRKNKIVVFQNVKRLIGTNVLINEHLTQRILALHSQHIF